MSRFSEKFLDHFYEPCNAKRMDGTDVVVGTAGKIGTGPFMIIYLRITEDIVSEASYQTYGCSSAIAAGSIVTQMVHRCNKAEAAALADERRIVELLDGCPKEKLQGVTLTSQALLAAVAQWARR